MRTRSHIVSAIGALVIAHAAACTTTSAQNDTPSESVPAPVSLRARPHAATVDIEALERALTAHAARREERAYACATLVTCAHAYGAFAVDDDGRALLHQDATPARAMRIRRLLARALLDDDGVHIADARPLFFDGHAPLLLAAARLSQRAATDTERLHHDAVVDISARVSLTPGALLARSVGLDEATLSTWSERVVLATGRAMGAHPTRVDEIPALLVDGALAIDPAHVLSGGLVKDVVAERGAHTSAVARCFVVDGAHDVRVVTAAGDNTLARIAARRARACATAVRAHAPRAPIDPLWVRAIEELSVDVVRAGEGHARARLYTLRAVAMHVRLALADNMADSAARDALASTWGDPSAPVVSGAALLLGPMNPVRDVETFAARLLARALSRGLTSTLGPAWATSTPDEVEDALRTLYAVVHEVGIARYLETLDDDPLFSR